MSPFLTVLWIVVLSIFLTVIAIAMPIVEAKTGNVKNFGVKCILISVLLMVAGVLSVIYGFYGDEFIKFGNSATRGAINVISEILLPMFIIFAVYFLLLGIFFPERKYELEREERERKAREWAKREREKREQNKKNNS